MPVLPRLVRSYTNTYEFIAVLLFLPYLDKQQFVYMRMRMSVYCATLCLVKLCRGRRRHRRRHRSSSSSSSMRKRDTESVQNIDRNFRNDHF